MRQVGKEKCKARKIINQVGRGGGDLVQHPNLVREACAVTYAREALKPRLAQDLVPSFFGRWKDCWMNKRNEPDGSATKIANF